MNIKLLTANIIFITLISSCATTDSSIDDATMGLSKISVFDTPTPMVPNIEEVETGESERMPIAYSTLPPQVKHTFDEYLPITLDENECIDCHDRRKYLERKGWDWKVGRKLPMPDDHYGSFNKQGGSEDVAGSRYICTQCHVQQSDATPLVDNTF